MDCSGHSSTYQHIGGQLSDFFDRLKEERLRLEMSQTVLAAHGGVTKDSQLNYESGRRTPDANYLAGVAAVGVDVLYVVTGQRKPVSQHVITAIEDDQSVVSGRKVMLLDEREQALLRNYSAADSVGKRYIEGTADLAAQQKANLAMAGVATRSVNVQIGGDVGQSIAGDQTNTGPVSFSVGKRK